MGVAGGLYEAQGARKRLRGAQPWDFRAESIQGLLLARTNTRAKREELFV